MKLQTSEEIIAKIVDTWWPKKTPDEARAMIKNIVDERIYRHVPIPQTEEAWADAIIAYHNSTKPKVEPLKYEQVDDLPARKAAREHVNADERRPQSPYSCTCPDPKRWAASGQKDTSGINPACFMHGGILIPVQPLDEEFENTPEERAGLQELLANGVDISKPESEQTLDAQHYLRRRDAIEAEKRAGHDEVG